MKDEDADVVPRIRRTHLALFVKDPFASAPWYEDVLGMKVTARGERWVFLSFGKKHHDIALIAVDSPESAVRGAINMQHYGWRLRVTSMSCVGCTECFCARRFLW